MIGPDLNVKVFHPISTVKWFLSYVKRMCVRLGADLHERFPHSMVMKAGPQLLHRAWQTVKTPEQTQTTAALSSRSRFHEPYWLYFPSLFSENLYPADWWPNWTGRTIKMYMDSSHTCNGTHFITNLLGVSIRFTLFMSTMLGCYLHESTARCKMEPVVRNHLTSDKSGSYCTWQLPNELWCWILIGRWLSCPSCSPSL